MMSMDAEEELLQSSPCDDLQFMRQLLTLGALGLQRLRGRGVARGEALLAERAQVRRWGHAFGQADTRGDAAVL